VLRDLGVDAAPWNIHERRVTRDGSRYLVGGVPLRAFHFSGFDPRIPDVMSARDYWERPRVLMSSEPALAELCAHYAGALYEAGFEQQHRTPFAFDYLADGTLIPGSLRTLYAEALLQAETFDEASPPDPFDRRQSDAFRVWAQLAYESARERVPARLAKGPARATTAAEWSGRMTVGPAGVRSPAGVVHLKAGSVGTVLSGPNALEDAGRYRVTTELCLGDEPAAYSSDSSVLLVEVLLDGHVLGCASVFERGHTTSVVEFVVPVRLQRVALSAGVQVRVSNRAGVSGTVDAVAVERVGDVSAEADDTAPADWLPAMVVGDVGQRTEVRVVKRQGQRGTMVEGPGWRLTGGRYRADFDLRTNVVQPGDGGTVVALVDVVVHGYVLAYRPVTRDDLRTGDIAVEFDVGGRWADHRYTRVELRVRTEGEVDASLGSVPVRHLGPSASLGSAVDADWLPAMSVTDNAVRSGAEIHSIDGASGALAHGPSWRLDPGRYRFDVTVTASHAGSDGQLEGGASVAKSESVAGVQVLLDGAVVAEQRLAADDLAGAVGDDATYALEFEVTAKKVPPPLLELTPLIDLVLTAGGQRPLQFRSAVLSMVEAEV